MQDAILLKIDNLISKIEKINAPSELQCYTVKKVANILDASENSIYNMIQSGVIEAFTVGEKGSKKPSYRISREALEKYMNERKEQK